MARQALGRGLSALLGDEAAKSASEELIEIDLDLITPSSEQPRTTFSEEKLEELVQSIRVNGVVQPVVVRRQNAHFELVAGERRWRAAQRAGLRKIPAIVKDVSDEKMLELALVENIQRQELNAIEEARAYRKLIDTVGLTQEMVAERVGKNRTVITTFLRLLKLPADIQKLLEEEKISAGHGRALLLTDDANAQRRIAKTIVEMSLSVREAENAVKRTGKGKHRTIADKELTKEIDPNFKAAETKLKRYFGTNVRLISDKKGIGGKIEIEYYSQSDLDRIYNLILKK
jgi:ParB family transcriptional regulator, chromosome partitioning protein